MRCQFALSLSLQIAAQVKIQLWPASNVRLTAVRRADAAGQLNLGPQGLPEGAVDNDHFRHWI